MFKKNMTALVALSMLLLFLTACGTGGRKKEADKGSPVKVNGDAIYPVECDDTLTFWTYLSPTVSSHYNSFGDTPLAKETEKRTGIKVKYEHPTGNGEEQLQLLIASNDLPDMVGHSWNNYPGGPQMAIDEELILNLDDLLKSYAPALNKVLAENKSWDKHVKTDKGNYYSFPFLLQEGILQVFYGPIIRQDWLEKTGMQSPETIDEWEQVLTAFKNECGARAPFTGNTAGLLTSFASGFNVFPDWYLNGDTVVYGPYDPNYKNLLIKMNDWYKKGLIDSDFSVITGQQINSNLLNGKSGVLIGYAGGTIGDNMQAGKDIPGFNLEGVKYPAPTKGGVAEYSRVASSVNMSAGVALSNNCKNPELAVRFLDYGFTEEGHNLYNFGIEGVSYNWENGYPKYTDLILNNPDGWSITDAMGAYMKSAYNGVMIQDQRYIEQYYQLPQQKNAQKIWGETNMEKHLLPQLYVDVSVMDKDSEIMANVKTYVDEMTLRFINGAESFDKYDKYLEELKKFGIEDAIKFRQDAYKVFLKR